MKRVTRWSPDTCGCVLEYEWDDTETETTRKHTFKNIVSRCPSHSHLAGQAVYNQVLHENVDLKNGVYGEIKKAIPSFEPNNYNWSFDANRKLKVGLLDIAVASADKQALVKTLNNKFADEVEVI